jgi:hypothetical protein
MKSLLLRSMFAAFATAIFAQNGGDIINYGPAERPRGSSEVVTAGPTVRVRGEIRQVVKEGLLVHAHYGTAGMGSYDAGSNRPEMIVGDFLIVGHPAQAQKVDQAWFDVDATSEGIFEYTTVLGATKRIKRLRVVRAFY